MKLIREPEVQSLLDNSIYKYEKLDNVKRTLNDLTFGFNSLLNFNDIYESEFNVAHFFRTLEESKKLMNPINNPITEVIKSGNDYLKNIKVTCFSHTGNNNLMWSHYSEMHSGVCYCIDFNHAKSPWQIGEIPWGNVLYSSQVPTVRVYQEQTTKSIFNMELSNVILTKSLEWAYEKEIRFYKRLDENFMHYNPEALKAIIIGRRVKENKIDELKKVLNEFNKKNNANTKLLYAHRVVNSYNLGIDSDYGYRNSCETNSSSAIPVLDGIDQNPITTIK